MSDTNPYDWSHHTPRRPIIRSKPLDDLVSRLRAGEGCVLVGGRGMGKSVLLHQVATRLRAEDPSVKVVYFRAPPLQRTPEASIRALAEKLGVKEPSMPDAGDVLDAYFAERKEQSLCVLLFDELDQYAVPRSKESLARTLFNHLEAVRKDSKRLGVLAAGGLGIYVLRDYLASAFMSRVEYASPHPFTEEEIEELSRPFAERGTSLDQGVLKAIHLASGGNPALATYGLQRLWDRPAATERDVTEVYADFRERRPDFLRSIRDAVAHPDFSEAPLRVWAMVQADGPLLPRARLIEACRTDAGVLRMDLDDVLRLLRSAGLIVQHGVTQEALDLRVVTSILNLPESSPTCSSVREQLVVDLRSVLAHVHRWAPDFFYSKRSKEKGEKEPKSIVPEAVFSAVVGITLQNLGWTSEREAVQGAGRTDLKLSRGDQGAVVELKLWQRNNYREIHEQIEGYWAPGVVAAAAIMITDKDVSSFAADYRRECLGRADLVVTEQPCEPPLHGHFTVESRNGDGFAVCVDHLLVRIPR